MAVQVLGSREYAASGAGVGLGSPAAAVRAITGRVPAPAAFPLGLLALLGAFLIVQHHIDRRDPKLALAPVRRSRLEFAPPPPRTSTR